MTMNEARRWGDCLSSWCIGPNSVVQDNIYGNITLSLRIDPGKALPRAMELHRISLGAGRGR